MTSSMKRPDLPQVEEYPRDIYVPEHRQGDKGFKENITGTAIARLPNYRRCGVLFAKGEEQDGIYRATIMGLDGTLWRREFSKDVWDWRGKLFYTCVGHHAGNTTRCKHSMGKKLPVPAGMNATTTSNCQSKPKIPKRKNDLQKGRD